MSGWIHPQASVATTRNRFVIPHLPPWRRDKRAKVKIYRAACRCTFKFCVFASGFGPFAPSLGDSVFAQWQGRTFIRLIGKPSECLHWATPKSSTRKAPSTAPCQQHQGWHHGATLMLWKNNLYSFRLGNVVFCRECSLHTSGSSQTKPLSFVQLPNESERAWNETLHDWNVRVTVCVFCKIKILPRGRERAHKRNSQLAWPI